MGPGEDIVSARRGTLAGYRTQSGTSSAAPFLTGVSLLMRDVRPSLSAATVKSRIRSTAVDWGLGGSNKQVGSRGPDVDFGWGRLDAYRALRAAGASQLDSPPSMPSHRLLEGALPASPRVDEYPLVVKDRCRPIAASLIIPGVEGV
jgi:serine protease AprX